MSKYLSVLPPRVVLAFFIILITAGCTYSIGGPISPGYKHFVPERDSLFKVEFDYPDTLAVKGDKGDSSGELFILDPRLPTSQPGLEPDIEQPLILLTVQQVNLQSFSLEREIALWREGTQQNPYMSTVNDRTIQIDHHPARQITTKTAPRPALGQRTTLIDEAIFLLVDDRYYRFSVQAPEGAQADAFTKVFDDLIRSMKIVP